MKHALSKWLLLATVAIPTLLAVLSVTSDLATVRGRAEFSNEVSDECDWLRKSAIGGPDPLLSSSVAVEPTRRAQLVATQIRLGVTGVAVATLGLGQMILLELDFPPPEV